MTKRERTKAILASIPKRSGSLIDASKLFERRLIDNAFKPILDNPELKAAIGQVVSINLVRDDE